MDRFPGVRKILLPAVVDHGIQERMKNGFGSICAPTPGFDRLSDQAYLNLRHGIIEGRFAAGERLTELHLCKALGMGRSPIREALLRLVGDDLVEAVPQAGYFVKNLTLEGIHEVYMIRCELECLAVRLACKKGFSDTKFLRLENAYECMLQSEALGDFTESEFADLDFHQALISLAGSSRLESVIRSSQLQILSWRGNHATDSDKQGDERTLKEHLQILQALSARDAHAAEKVLRHHILGKFEASMITLAHPKTHPIGFLGGG